VELGKVFLLFHSGLEFRGQVGNDGLAALGQNGQRATPGRRSGELGRMPQSALEVPREQSFKCCPFQGRLSLELAEQVIGQIQGRSHKHIFASKHFNVKFAPVLESPRHAPIHPVIVRQPLVCFISEVPEPTTIIAGALLLLPFGMSTLRMLRKNRNS
jgi:hypothetical protein